MPRRLESHPHWNPEDTREELVANATTTELAVGPLALRAGAVPLFRTVHGNLQQAIRVRIDGPAGPGAASVSIAAGEHVLDAAVLASDAFGTSVHLFVPEVTGDTSFKVAVETGSHRRAADLAVAPQRKWSVHLIHHSHFDYGYTDRQAVVMENQLRYLDATLDLIAQTDDWPEEARFRWNVEVTYPLQAWFAARPRAVREQMIRRIKEGRVEINALPFSMHSEVYSIDELAWGLTFVDEMREQHGIEIVSAIQSDVPGATIGLLNLLTAADIRYFSVAHNYAGRSVPFRAGGQELTRPFWWQGADGKRLLVWQSDTPHGVAYMDGVLVGMSENERVARGLLPDYLAALASRPYPYGKHAFGWHDLPAGLPVTKQPYPHDLLCLRVQNSLADNAPPTRAVSETVRDWNDRWTYPRLRVSTNRDFFTVAEEELGDRLDTFAGDWTDWWVDGVGSGALPLGLNRQTQSTVRTAQTLHTLARVTTGDRIDGAVGEIERVYEGAALFDEHTWGSANPWEDKLEERDSGQLQWGRKSAFAYEAFDRANVLLDSGLHQFAAGLAVSQEALASVAVFNPSGWIRTDLVRVFVPAERVPPGTAIALMNAATGQSVPVSLEPQRHPGFRGKGQWLTFVAAGMPPVGFLRFDIRSAPDDQGGNANDRLDSHTLESRFYRVRLDPRDGFVASIVDRDTDRELVDSEAPFGFNEYIYDRYTSGTGFNHLSGRIEDVDLTLFGSRSTAMHASVIGRSSDGVADRVAVRLVAEGAGWLESTISLPRDLKRIDICNRLYKIATPAKESVFFAFPFAMDDPDPEYEITGGVTSLDAPHVPGSAQHMFAIRHWLGLQDARGSAAWVTHEAPLVELGTISLPYSPFPPTTPPDRSRRSTVYSWALNNLWDTNFPPSQGGEMCFRYAISSDASLSRRELGIHTGASASAPLVGVCVRGNGGLGDASGSFVEVDNPLVQVITVAESRHDNAIVAYLHSLASETVETQVAFPALRPVGVKVGNHLERHLKDAPLAADRTTVTVTPGALIAVVITAGES